MDTSTSVMPVVQAVAEPEADQPRARPACRLFTPAQACEMFGVALRTWTQWQKEGRVQGIRRGKHRLYSSQELDALQERIRRLTEPYPDPERPGCYRVTVSSGKHEGMEAIIDAESLPLVQGKRWWWSPGNHGHGTVVLAVDGSPKPPLHQVIMGVHGPEFRVGHLNGDPLDCRRDNLVVRNASEQKAATRKTLIRAGREMSSRFKGVSRASPNARWSASITAYGRLRPLGRFRSEVGAALAYDDAAREIFGQHARLNFPDADDAARMRVAAAEEENAALPDFPPSGMIDRRGACRMFGVAYETWQHWENEGRVPAGQWVPRPFGKPGGRCKVYSLEALRQRLDEFNRIGKPYPDPERTGCYRVPIRSWLHQMEAIIDAADLSLVEGRSWNWAPRSSGYSARVVLATTARPTPVLARLVAGVSDEAMKVSHINRDPLDCRRANLIARTMAEQAPANRKMGTVNGRKYTSRFKGVSWCEAREKWVAQISKGEMHRNIGRFEDEIDAAEAYDEAAQELFGEHAHLNFPDGVDAFLEAEAGRGEAVDRPDAHADPHAGGTSFPPAGWVRGREAARMLGVRLATLTCNAWPWRLRCGKTVSRPGGGRCNIYPLDEIERIRAARAAASQPPEIPDGFVDKDGACRFFGITRFTWKKWIQEGKVGVGQIIRTPIGGKQKLYAVADLERLREELFGEDKLYKRGTDGVYHVPAGLVRRDEAWERFGVSKCVWERWERDGLITCGERVPGGPKLYQLGDINRMLDEYGKFCPPYPDPERPGVYRVPLSGREIKRREAIIDAEDVRLISGGTCHLAQTGTGRYETGGGVYVGLCLPDGTSTPLRRVIMGVSDRGRQVGHVNGDPLDCRRANLVVRSIKQRSHAARKMKSVRGQPCTSRFKGVFWETHTKKWRAGITVDGKCRWLGRFGDEVAAAEAYDDAARKWFGEHARLNFPDGVDAFHDAEATKIAAARAAESPRAAA